MKRIFVFCAVVGGLCLGAGKSEASWGHLSYSGYQPWWNIFAKRNHCMTAEEKRLQRFWHDYYDALRHYYQSLDHIDWVAYYKNHGYQLNSGAATGQCGGSPRIQFAPVFVSPQMQWALPNGCAGSPAGPAGPGMGAIYGYGQ